MPEKNEKPNNSNNEEFFSKLYFETWLKQASLEIKDWFDKEIEYLKKNIKSDSKILDIGCGFGRHIEIIADFSKEIIGIDNNEYMIKKAKDRLSNFKNVRLFLQDARKLDFEDNYFNYIICMTNTFGNFPKMKEAVLKEMKRVCKKGGKIIISVYNDKALEIRKEDYEKVGLHITEIKDGVVYTKEGLISEQFSKQQLITMFNQVGLDIIEIKEIGIAYICKLNKPYDK